MQTEVGEVAMEWAGRLPFRDYPSYAGLVLFHCAKHPVLSRQPEDSTLKKHICEVDCLDNPGPETSLLPSSQKSKGMRTLFRNCFVTRFFTKNFHVGFFRGRNKEHSPDNSLNSSLNNSLSNSLNQSLNNPFNLSLKRGANEHWGGGEKDRLVGLLCSKLSHHNLVCLQDLLCRKHFILKLVSALEAREDFVVRHKAHLASLLSLCLQPHVAYHTRCLYCY